MTATRRRYTKQQKASTAIAAEMTSITAASEATGIPRTTITEWMNDPEIVELRRKTREERAEAATTMSLVVLGEIKRRLSEFEPRDLSTLYGILTDKGQLLGGSPTSRTESIALTDGMDDHEKAALRKVLDEVVSDAG